MQRQVIGILALLSLLAFGTIFWTRGMQGINAFFPAMCMRLGITLGAIWLCIPDLNRLFKKVPPHIFIATIILLILLATRRELFVFAIGIVIVGVFIQLFASRFGLKKPKPKRDREANRERKQKHE